MTVLLFALWLILNGRITPEIVIFGLGIDALVTFFTIRLMGWSMEKERILLRTAPLIGLYALDLVWEAVKAALAVLPIALLPSGERDPALVEFRSGLPREYQNVILANSITLTPGTITVFQEGDRFVVHALRREWAEGLDRSSFVRLLRRFP